MSLSILNVAATHTIPDEMFLIHLVDKKSSDI